MTDSNPDDSFTNRPEDGASPQLPAEGAGMPEPSGGKGAPDDAPSDDAKPVAPEPVPPDTDSPAIDPEGYSANPDDYTFDHHVRGQDFAGFDDWDDGPPRRQPDDEDAGPPRRRETQEVPLSEIPRIHAEMLAELIFEAHAMAMEYFGIARAIDDRVPGRSRKIYIAAKLSGLLNQLISTADKHREKTGGG